MRALPFLLLLIHICVVFCTRSTPSADNIPIGNTISYQLHSYDDLREWRQAFNKGAQWLKVDPNWQPYEFCVQQERFFTNDSRGCMILAVNVHLTPVAQNHNDPTSTAYRTTYNTTDDILAFISAPENTDIFRNWSRYHNPGGENMIHIALCYKTDAVGPPCAENINAANWISLVEDFYANATNIIAQYNLNLAFVIDGGGVPGDTNLTDMGCLVDLARPWPWTWQYPGDPSQAFELNWPSELGFDRFQVLDDPIALPTIPLWELQAELGYGKFANSPYPYLLWEPADQLTISGASSVYTNRNKIHLPGLRFAINIDLVQFQLYAANESALAWNYANSSVVVMSHGINATTGARIAPLYSTIIFPLASGGLGVQYNPFSTPVDPQIKFTAPVALANSTRLTPGPVSVASLGHTVIASDALGNYLLYSFSDINGPSLSVFASGSLSLTNVTSVSLVSLNNQTLALFSANFSSVSCGVKLYLYSLTPSPSSLLTSVCVPVATGSTYGASALISASDPGSLCGNAPLSGLLVYARIEPSKTNFTAYAAAFCISLSPPAFSVQVPAYVGAGAAPSLSALQVNGITQVMLLLGESFCWNIDGRNKDAVTALCDNTPYNVPFVLSYTFGRLDALAAHVASGSLFSPCDVDLLHGAYDGGSLPVAQLYAVQALNSSAVSVGVVTSHRGIATSLIGDLTSECGAPRGRDVVVLDSWALPPAP